MTVILPNSVFLHVPKAGGTWVREVLKNAKLTQDELTSISSDESTEGKMRSWHCVPQDKSIFDGKYVFCFVRHPLTWYQSHWAFRKRNKNWNQGNRLDEKCQSKYFDKFISNVVKEFPEGYLHWLYGFYTQHADFIGKVENLQQDLMKALDMAGEEHRIDDLASVTPRNVTPVKYTREAKYTLENALRILELEQKAIEEYGYSYRVPVL
jgi:hypothetical protein